MEFKDLLENDEKAKAILKKERETISKLEKKLEWHKKRESKLWGNSGPFETILIPLCKEICKRKGFKYFEIYGPFGMCCETSLYFSNEGKEKNWRDSRMNDIDICKVDTWSIQLTYNNNTESGYQYWTGEVTNRYPKGSIGELNGENNVYAPLPADIDEIIKLLRFSKAFE